MEHFDERSKAILKAHEKILKIVNGMDSPSAMAVINFTFLKLVLSETSEPIGASAMTATFMRNVLNSIYDYYHGPASDDEPIH
jgi:hypothetical protein